MKRTYIKYIYLLFTFLSISTAYAQEDEDEDDGFSMDHPGVDIDDGTNDKYYSDFSGTNGSGNSSDGGSGGDEDEAYDPEDSTDREPVGSETVTKGVIAGVPVAITNGGPSGNSPGTETTSYRIKGKLIKIGHNMVNGDIIKRPVNIQLVEELGFTGEVKTLEGVKVATYSFTKGEVNPDGTTTFSEIEITAVADISGGFTFAVDYIAEVIKVTEVTHTWNNFNGPQTVHSISTVRDFDPGIELDLPYDNDYEDCNNLSECEENILREKEECLSKCVADANFARNRDRGITTALWSSGIRGCRARLTTSIPCQLVLSIAYIVELQVIQSGYTEALNNCDTKCN